MHIKETVADQKVEVKLIKANSLPTISNLVIDLNNVKSKLEN